MHAIRRTAYAASLSIVIGATAGCAASPAKAPTTAAASPSGPATTQSATAGSNPPGAPAPAMTLTAGPLSQGQLEGVLLSTVSGLKRDPSSDGIGLDDVKYAAKSGGPECGVFLDAINQSATAYHPAAEVDLGYQLSGLQGAEVTTLMTSYSSPATAQRVLDDARTGAEHCPDVTYVLNGNSLAYHDVTIVTNSGADGASTGFQATFSANGNAPTPVTMETFQVGTVALNVSVYNDPDPAGLLQKASGAAIDQLREIEGAQLP